MRRIFIMRHGQPDNPRNVVYGDLAGFGLNQKGELQATEAGQFMKGIPLDLIITSNLDRAVQTGKIVGDTNVGHPQHMVDPRLRDNLMGDYSGVITNEEYEANWEKYWDIRSRGLNGTEPPKGTQARVVEAFSEYTQAYADKTILFVFHGDPIAFLKESLTGEALAPSYPHHLLPKGGIYEVILGEANQVNLIFQPTNV